MLGLLLLYFIGKYYNDLFNLYKTNESKSWPYVVLGIAVYYVGTFIFGIAAVLLGEAVFDIDIDNMNELALSLLAMPFGILATFGVYKCLENKWKAEYIDPNLALEEIGGEQDDEQPLIR